jgi:hypothetical protein
MLVSTQSGDRGRPGFFCSAIHHTSNLIGICTLLLICKRQFFSDERSRVLPILSFDPNEAILKPNNHSGFSHKHERGKGDNIANLKTHFGFTPKVWGFEVC